MEDNSRLKDNDKKEDKSPEIQYQKDKTKQQQETTTTTTTIITIIIGTFA